MVDSSEASILFGAVFEASLFRLQGGREGERERDREGTEE